MKGYQSVAVGLAAWLTVAGFGSAMAWAVISRAGSDVVSASPMTSSARYARPAAEQSPSPEQFPSPGRSRSPRDTAAPEPSPTSAPPTTPSATGSPSPPSSAPSSSSAPPVTSPSPTVRRQSTWQGLSGTVVISCFGKRATLDAAQPDTGYQVRIRDRGPDEIEVEFEGQGANEGARTRVAVECVSGKPRIEADVDRA